MFEEVKEMIDSTIYENGRGEVGAKNVNLAMHGMVDATEEELGKVNDAVKTVEDKVTALEENGTGGGSGALRVWLYEVGINDLTQEQVNENIATYNSLLKDAAQPVVLCMSYVYSDADMSVTITQTMVGAVSVNVAESGGQIIDSQVVLGASDFNVVLSQDGMAEIIAEELPASSGPLRVWINEENTPEQVAENVSTYEALMQDVSKSVILMNAEETMTFSFNPVVTIVINESTPRVLLGFIPSSVDGVVALTTCVLFADGSILIDG